MCLSLCSFNSRCSASISTNCSQAAWARSLLRPLARSSCHWDAFVLRWGPSRSSLSWPASLGLENALKGILERFSGVFCVGLCLTCENFVGHVAHSLVFVHELPFPL